MGGEGHPSRIDEFGAGPFDVWKGPGLALTSNPSVKSTQRGRQLKGGHPCF
jgi:hypothetical protein